MKLFGKILMMGAIFFCGLNNIFAAETNFSDIKKHWAKETIEKFVTNEIVNGYEDNTFKPDNNVTYAEFLKMIVVAGKYDLVRKGNSVWPDFYINTAKENNLIISEAAQDAECLITRKQACEIIANFIDVSKIKMARNKFKDLSGDCDEVLKLVDLGVIGGYKDKTFRGENYLTRAEAITIIDRAIDQKESLVNNRKYLVNDGKLSNYKTEEILKNGLYSKTRYEIKCEDIYIYDDGRYAKLNGYKFSGEYIESSKIIKAICSLINENAYVAILYQPSDYTLNQLQILYGDSEEKLACGEVDFSITFYENNFYELSRIAMEDKFSNEVFAKIEVIKLWDELSKFEKGQTVDSFKKSKLKSMLKEICKSDSEKVCNYIIQKYKEYAKGKMHGKEVKEHKVFSNFILDLYKKDDGVLTFYLSER